MKPDGPDAARVFERVRECMRSLVGGSGHLGSYSLDRETFRITAARALDGGLTEYDFVVRGSLEDEFTVYDEATPPPREEELRGTIVLDASFGLTRDDAGRVRLRPWTVFEGPGR